MESTWSLKMMLDGQLVSSSFLRARPLFRHFLSFTFLLFAFSLSNNSLFTLCSLPSSLRHLNLAGMWNLPGRNGKMPNLDKFDAEFFGIPESEVNYIDPQERILLEGTYEAIIDAGESPRQIQFSFSLRAF